MRDQEENSITLKIRDQETDEWRTIHVSIQDASEYNGEDVGFHQGKYSNSPLFRALACDALKNAEDNEIANFCTFPEAKKGIFSKTDKVPIIKKKMNRIYLELGSGYMTKINEENIYIQKCADGYFRWNYSGFLVNPVQEFKDLATARKDLPEMVEEVGRIRKSEMRIIANGQMEILNKNLGKIDFNVWRSITSDEFKRVGEIVLYDNFS